MPTANNISELERQILAHIHSVMDHIQGIAYDEMKKGTEDFYSHGNNKQYVRTGNFGRTPRVSFIKKTGDGYSFDAYLEQEAQYTQYTTGDNPTMMQVLPMLEYGRSQAFTTTNGKRAVPANGRTGFWGRTKKRINKRFKSEIQSAFR